jgi:hypothetical protein
MTELPNHSTAPDVRQHNSAFSAELPTMQLAWDSTSLGALKTCPRYYQYYIVEAWRPKGIYNVHFFFGSVYHAALERYDHAIAQGLSHDNALDAAVAYALEASWDRELNRPWTSDDPNKNRFTLLRSIVWYAEQFQDDPFKTLILANGKPAVELSFRYELHGITPFRGDEPYMHCGHLDKIGVLDGKAYIQDKKTTKRALDEHYFDQYTPDNQFSGYAVAGQIALRVPIVGLIVDAAQIMVGFTRFMRGPIYRTQGQLDEWYQALTVYIKQAESYARANFWPQNDKACFRCDFRGICSLSPETRKDWLKHDFTQVVWDPLKVRGDV